MFKPSLAIPIDTLRQVLSWDADTGAMTWNSKPEQMFKSKRQFVVWNIRFSGKPALYKTNRIGYACGMVCGRYILAHRAIWALHYGEWPTAEIDHIDGNKLNNSISNLRLATRAQNIWNTGKGRNNTSGFRGVSLRKDSGLWMASITENGKTKRIGYYDSPETAAIAYRQEEIRLHGDFVREVLEPKP